MEREEESGLVQAAHRHITLTVKGEKIWVQATPINISGTSIYNPYGKRESTGHANHTAGGKAESGDTQKPHPQYGTRKSYGGRQGPVRGQVETPPGGAETLTPAGRDPHPRGRQPGHQGEWASVKETSHTQRLQPVH